MTTAQGNDEQDGAASLVDALLVYAEPLAASGHVVVLGDSESTVADRLLELGARSVHVFDPDPARAANAARTAQRGVTVRALVDDLDVRDGAFDLALVSDLSDLDDPRGAIGRLRRAVGPSGTVVALGRASVGADRDPAFQSEVGPAAVSYEELYELFASEFEEVTLVGVVPFTGVVFAQLGAEGEEPNVSVDTRLVAPEAPSVFVVVAAQEASRANRAELDPYAIVQIDEQERAPSSSAFEDTRALEAAFAAAQLQAELLAAERDAVHERLIVSDVRAVEAAARLDRASMERDVALTRAMELEAVLAASQQSLEMLERRVLDAEREARASTSASDRELVERLVARAEHAEAAFAVAQEELASRAESAVTEVDLRVEDLSSIVGRAERAEAELARIADELAHLGDAHGLEAAGYESQLQDRARFVAALEKELLRREQLVKELVASLEAQAEKSDPAGPRVFETSAPLPAPPVPTVGAAELATLRAKLDELATEIARRDGELTARGWRITELENERERLLRQVEGQPAERQEAAKPGTLQHAGSATVDELNALRQALAQEHAARVAAESGEELSRARAELARQSALLEQIRGQRESSRS